MISVCLASYNGEKYIRQQVDSILSQLGPTDELIVSDDGSKDETLNVLSAIDDSRLNVIHNEAPHGVKHNFVNALNNAKGDYFFFSDQDDVWLPNKVELFMKAFNEGANVVISNCYVTDSDLNKTGELRFPGARAKIGLLDTIYRPRWQGSCMAFDRKSFNAFSPIPKSKYIEHDTWIGLTVGNFKGFKRVVLSEPTILYRRHSGCVSMFATRGMKKRVYSDYSLSYKLKMRVVMVAKLLKWELSQIFK